MVITYPEDMTGIQKRYERELRSGCRKVRGQKALLDTMPIWKGATFNEISL